MSRLAAFCQQLEEGLEYPRPAEPPEPLPYAVPFAKLAGQRTPSYVVNGEVVERLQEFTVVMPRLPRLDCAASNTSSTIDQSRSVIPVSMSGSLMPVTH